MITIKDTPFDNTITAKENKRKSLILTPVKGILSKTPLSKIITATAISRKS